MPELANIALFNDPNLVSYYKLEDTSDSKGSNTLTNNGGTPFNPAKFGNGADFGTGNSTKYLGVASNLGFIGSDNVSFSFWVKRNNAGAPSETYVWLSTTTSTDRYMSVTYDGLTLIFTTSNGANANYNPPADTVNFHHIVAVRDVSNSASHLYYDGIKVADGTMGTTTHSTNLFNIGNAGGNVNYSNAIIDDVAVFSRALVQADVNALYYGSAGSLLFFL